MPENYVLLERTELNASAASVTFANIPQTGYTDLKIVASIRSNNAGQPEVINLSLNGSTSSFTNRDLFGTGSSTASQTNNSAGFFAEGNTWTANTFSNSEIYIPNYTSSNFKSISTDSVSENNGTDAYAQINAILWSNTGAINSVGLTLRNGTAILAGSTFSLYGIAAVGTTPAIAPKASGGNIIDYDGTYWIHTFLTSGTFTPQVGLTCDYLVVAGGGGGGGCSPSAGVGGGGGAGGFRTGNSLSIGTSLTVTVGAGGTGGANFTTAPTNGSDSIFSTITSSGGGRGGYSTLNGAAGGSGGGGEGSYNGGAGNTPSTSPSQGNNGGNGTATAPNYPGGGGGGAGAIGGNGSGGTIGGVGGNGTASSISGSSVTYAGGGGAGTYNGGTPGAGGSGGGGAGRNAAIGGAGTVNLGGGGGGTGGTPSLGFAGGAGGSGIVIIRYPAA